MSLSRRLWKVFKLFKWESVTSAELMDDWSETNEETRLYLLHFSLFVINLPPPENAAKLQIMYKWGFFCVCVSASPQKGKVFQATHLVLVPFAQDEWLRTKRTKENSTPHIWVDLKPLYWNHAFCKNSLYGKKSYINISFYSVNSTVTSITTTVTIDYTQQKLSISKIFTCY